MTKAEGGGGGGNMCGQQRESKGKQWNHNEEVYFLSVVLVIFIHQ